MYFVDLPSASDITASASTSSSVSTSNERSEFAETVAREERRSILPAPAPSGSEVPSLWGILKKNIGKDLSRISMPVALNEPLGVLQRMCEELEYSELLDSASMQQLSNKSLDAPGLCALDITENINDL
jgi:hypothetical protein